MAKVSYVNPVPDLKDRFDKLFTPVYKTKKSSLRWNGGLISPRKVNPVSTRSLLPQIRDLWASMSTELKDQWKAAGEVSGYSGWQQFVQDTSYRIKFAIDGVATPSILHQYRVGRINMDSPAQHFRLEQLHPVEYYQAVKVPGTKSQRVPRVVREQLLLPLQLAASYRSNLTPNGDDPFCRFYAEIYSSYQGRDIVTPVGFDIPLSSGWARQTTTATNVLGVARWYSLYIELNDVLGAVEFDIIHAIHTGTNFARDFRCTNIQFGLSNYNYQLPASWAADAPETGVTWGSIYPSDDPL